MASKVLTSGWPQMQRNLRSMRGAIKGPAVDKVATTALTPMKDETVVRARVRRQLGRTPKGGHLDQGVVIAKVESKFAFRRVFWVSFRKRARRIAHLVEFGTAPHAQPRRGIYHPGARAFPFFRPAYEAKKAETLRLVGVGLWAVIEASLVSGTKAGRR